jgi:hypothetical protein
VNVHVDEMHTDVVPAGGGAAEPQAHPAKHLGAALERWLEACADSARLGARTSAQGFDD